MYIGSITAYINVGVRKRGCFCSGSGAFGKILLMASLTVTISLFAPFLGEDFFDDLDLVASLLDDLVD